MSVAPRLRFVRSRRREYGDVGNTARFPYLHAPAASAGWPSALVAYNPTMPPRRDAPADASSSLVRVQPSGGAKARTIAGSSHSSHKRMENNDLLADDAVSRELLSLLTGKLTGNFANFRGKIGVKPAPESLFEGKQADFLAIGTGKNRESREFPRKPQKIRELVGHFLGIFPPCAAETLQFLL